MVDPVRVKCLYILDHSAKEEIDGGGQGRRNARHSY